MTIYGWDMSHYDAVTSATADKAMAEGFRFVTHKAGGDATDAEMDDFWTEFRGYRANMLLGAYWVLYPGNPAGRADQFLARLDATCPGWRDGPFILQIDCEKWGGDLSTVPSISEINAHCDRLVAKMPKLRPIVYAPEWVYGSKVSSLRYPLWASNYVSGAGAASKLYPGDNSGRWGAYGGKVPAVLQFTSSATIAGQTTCDANAYRGTLTELTALVAPGWKEDEAMAFIENQADFEAALTAWASKQNLPGSSTDLKTGETSDVKRSLAGTLNALVTVGLQDAAHPELGQTSLAGRNTLNQGVPNPLTDEADGKTPAWTLLQDIAKGIKAIQDALGSADDQPTA